MANHQELFQSLTITNLAFLVHGGHKQIGSAKYVLVSWFSALPAVPFMFRNFSQKFIDFFENSVLRRVPDMNPQSFTLVLVARDPSA